MKREQAQTTIPSLAKKFVAIFKFRHFSVTFGFYILDWIVLLNHKTVK